MCTIEKSLGKESEDLHSYLHIYGSLLFDPEQVTSPPWASFLICKIEIMILPRENGYRMS